MCKTIAYEKFFAVCMTIRTLPSWAGLLHFYKKESFFHIENPVQNDALSSVGQQSKPPCHHVSWDWQQDWLQYTWYMLHVDNLITESMRIERYARYSISLIYWNQYPGPASHCYQKTWPCLRKYRLHDDNWTMWCHSRIRCTMWSWVSHRFWGDRDIVMFGVSWEL